MSQSYENLNVWKESIKLASSVYLLTKKFPREEQFGLISQLRRGVISISTNIAEGSSRKSKKDYMRFLDISIGSLNEVESLLHVSQHIGIVSKEECSKIHPAIISLGKSLGAFRKYLQK
jgi:four helix bundle protein